MKCSVKLWGVSQTSERPLLPGDLEHYSEYVQRLHVNHLSMQLPNETRVHVTRACADGSQRCSMAWKAVSTYSGIFGRTGNVQNSHRPREREGKSADYGTWFISNEWRHKITSQGSGIPILCFKCYRMVECFPESCLSQQSGYSTYY